MSTIHFNVNGSLCATECPFKMSANGETIFVGSGMCRECKYNKGVDVYNNTVVCDHPEAKENNNPKNDNTMEKKINVELTEGEIEEIRLAIELAGIKLNEKADELAKKGNYLLSRKAIDEASKMKALDKKLDSYIELPF